MFTAEDVRPIVIFQTDGDQAFALQPSTPTLYDMPTPPIPAALKEHFSLRDLYQTIERSRASVYTVIPGMRHIEVINNRELPAVQPPRVDQPTVFKTLVTDYVRWQQLAAAGAAIGGWAAYLQKPEDAPTFTARSWTTSTAVMFWVIILPIKLVMESAGKCRLRCEVIPNTQ